MACRAAPGAWRQAGLRRGIATNGKRGLASGYSPPIPGADETNRTSDILITNDHNTRFIGVDFHASKPRLIAVGNGM